MVIKVLGKIYGRLKFLYHKQKFISSSLHRMLSNSLIQPHFHYACSAWYPNLNKIYKKKVQVAQNKCIRFCVFWGNRAHLGVSEFRKINWLPTRERFEQCISVGAFKFCKNISPAYMSDIFKKTNAQHNTRRSTEMLNPPRKNTNLGQQGLSYLGPKFWNFCHKKLNFPQVQIPSNMP